MKSKGYAKFGGGGGAIRCIMGNVEVAYMKIGGKNLEFHFVKCRKTSSAMQKYC